MPIRYHKNKDDRLLRQMEEKLQVTSALNYVPIYERFFKLNKTNWNHVNLQTPWAVQEVLDASGAVVLRNASGDETRPAKAFFKYSPLLDPNRYMSGGYEGKPLDLPSFLPAGAVMPKMQDVNNSSYVDAFFSFLSDRLRTLYPAFAHGIEFYGSFLAVKRSFAYNLEDEYIVETNFFRENTPALFEASGCPAAEGNSRRKCPKLEVAEETVDLDLVDVVEVGAAPAEEREVEAVEIQPDPTSVEEVEVPAIDESEDEDDWSDDDDSKESVTGSESEPVSGGDDDSSGFFSEPIPVTIFNFPVQIIAMERCANTFDSLIDALSPEELVSALFQIVFTLLVYQEVYEFTHNDLHTNNVMYVATSEPHLYYAWKGKSYCVPTFGRVYKIIDFGRSIYTFEGMRFMSDSFHAQGDAATQYNCEPFYDNTKPRLDPNYSFDLCRLACSMVDMLPETEEFAEVNDLINEWCMDDKGRHVVFKQNGEERYPNFKLYKMIARTVHAHTPRAQLDRPLFKKFEVAKSELQGKTVLNASHISKI